jgi:hypothetical protein
LAFTTRNDGGHDVFQGGREGFAPLAPDAFQGMPDGTQTRGLFDDDDVLVEVSNGDLLRLARLGRRAAEQFDGITFLQPAGGIEAQFAQHLDTATANEGTNLAPRLAGQARSQGSSERGAGLVGWNGERG